MKRSILLKAASFAVAFALFAAPKTFAQTGPVQNLIAGNVIPAMAGGSMVAIVAPDEVPGSLRLSMDNHVKEKLALLISGPDGVVYASETERPVVNYRFDLSALPDGFYRLRIKKKGKNIVHRFRLQSDGCDGEKKLLF